MSNLFSSWQEMLSELKKLKGLARNGYAGNPAYLEKVKADEVASVKTAQEAHKAAVKGENLARLSILDPVTELYNHEALVKELKAELKRSARYQHTVAICMLGIDGFEAVILEHGALTGDALLRVVANAIRTGVPEADIVGRYSEHQFIILLPGNSAAQAALVVNHIRERIGNQAIMHNWQRFSVTASAGIACFPHDAEEYDQLIARAMEAMECAIARGGDRVLSV
jgi:diguanylate cyclase (GGDEF)-like protein